MLISVLPLFCLSFLISLCSFLSFSFLLLFPFFAVIFFFSIFIPHPRYIFSFLPINLLEYSTCPQLCFASTYLLRYRNWSCSVAFLKMSTSYRLRKSLTLSVTFHVPFNGVFTSAYNHMRWAMCALTLYLKQPKSSKPKFLFPFPHICPYLSEITPWLAAKYRNHTHCYIWTGMFPPSVSEHYSGEHHCRFT